MKTLLLSLALAVVAMSGDARAECIIKGTICYELQTAELVFVGEVVDVSPDPDAGQRRGDRQRVDFRVLESFKGVQSGELSLTFAAYLEQPTFSRGTRVLVYASRSVTVSGQTGVWGSTCGRSRQVFPNEPELVALRVLTGSANDGVVAGHIELRGADGRRLPVPAGLRVALGSMDGSRLGESTLSDGSGLGVFLFPRVGQGRYSVTVESAEHDAQPVSVSVSRAQCVDVSLIVRRRSP